MVVVIVMVVGIVEFVILVFRLKVMLVHLGVEVGLVHMEWSGQSHSGKSKNDEC